MERPSLREQTLGLKQGLSATRLRRFGRDDGRDGKKNDASGLQRRGTRLPEGSARLARGQHAAGSGRGKPPQPHQPCLQGAPAAVAEEAREPGLALSQLAQGIWRAGLELDAEIHLRDGDGARQLALSLVVQHQDGGARPDEVRQRRAEEALPAEDRRRRGAVVPGLFRTWLGLRSRVTPHQGEKGRATTTSSTARRSGPPTRIMPTGSSASCAPRTRASARRASPSC